MAKKGSTKKNCISCGSVIYTTEENPTCGPCRRRQAVAQKGEVAQRGDYARKTEYPPGYFELKPWQKRFGFAVLALMVLLVLSLFSVQADRGSRSRSSQPAAQAPMTVSGTRFERGEYGTRYVVGQVRNNTANHYSYVQVEINLYDRDGTQVGSTLDNVNNLEPHSVWRFRALVTEENVRSFKVKGVRGH